jgi:hypothetical protein
MNWRTTLVLAAIVLGVLAYLKFFEVKEPSTGEAKRQAQNVVNFDRNKISGIVIQNGDEKIEMQRRGNRWRLEAPIKDQADSSLIESLLSDLENWQKDGTISAKEIETDQSKLNEYGVNRPKLRLKLIGQDRPPAILFGKDAALEGKMYVRFENSKETFLAGQSVKKDIDKKSEEFRDRKLTGLITAQVTRVTLKTPAGEMELQKKGDHWDIVKPLRARGDDQKIADLIAQITTARIQQFVADDHGDLHGYGLAEPRGTLTLYTQDDKQGQLLQIGGVPEKEKDQRYVRFAPRGFVYTVPKKIEEILSTKPDDLRDRQLVRVDTNILDRITIAPADKTKILLARKGENWTIASLNNTPANSGEIRRFIDTLQNERVTKFVEDVGSNLAKYGLDQPQLQLTFSSFASENTAETKAGEQPFAAIAFGKVDGDNVYARLADEPFVVAVRRGLVDQIFTDPLQWQELSIFKFKPEQIHRFSIATDKELWMERDEKKQWRWLKGSGEINQANVQSLISALANLHAVRWLGTTASRHGLDTPQLTLTFMYGPESKDSSTLTVGSRTEDGMWSAHVDGREGTFVISNSDLNALKLPLVSQATASPSPTRSPVAKP